MEEPVTATEILTTTLRRLRTEAGYTQEKVSRLLKIQRATYCNYENGSRTPSLDILVALAELYHVSVDYLIRGIDAIPCTGAHSKELFREVDHLPAGLQQEILDFIRFKKLLISSRKNRKN